jgi:hypothetical protein
MTLIIEDGSIVDNANSYITSQEYADWADARFGAGRSTAPSCDEDIEALIFRSMDYFEAQNFIGTKVVSTQSLQWPRYNVYIDGFYQSSTSIPKEVKSSIYELSYAEEVGNSELAPVERKTSMEKVGELEVEYADNSSSKTSTIAVPNAMRKLLGYGANRVVRV